MVKVALPQYYTMKPFEGPTGLSPDFARSNPELFRAKLLENLEHHSALSGSVWRKLCERKQTSPALLEIDPTRWDSISHAIGGRIRLGAAFMQPTLHQVVTFEDWKFRGEREYVYRLSHELAHLVHPKIFGLFAYRGKALHGDSVDFMNTVFNARQGGVGFSPLGSLETYRVKGPHEQAVEDHAELMNMFALDPEYLKRYLTFLGDPAHSHYRAAHQLMDVDTDTAKYILESIKSSYEFFFDDSNEQ